MSRHLLVKIITESEGVLVPPKPPPPEYQIRAFELVSEGNSLAATRQILNREGIEVKGLETVRRWAKAGARAAALLREMTDDPDEQTSTPEFVRQKFTHFLNELLKRGFEELDRGEGTYKEIAPIMLRIATEEARVLGGYAALEIHHTYNGGKPIEVDPNTAALIAHMQEKARQRDEELRKSGDTECES